MPFPPSPEDRPDPNENMPAMRARIPDHIARGEISTGVIVVTGPTEYVLDFVRNLPRPNAIVARVILPHLVMPQFVEALTTNVELFRQRYGELPGTPNPPTITHPFQSGPGTATNLDGVVSDAAVSSVDVWPGSTAQGQAAEGSSNDLGTGDQNPNNSGQNTTAGSSAANPNNSVNPSNGNPSNANQANGASHLKRQNPQEVYDDLKLRDEILSGAYANAVMIGHGPYEFSFDFITNFYPQSAVSCRVYMASGHIYRLLESLRASWEQLRPRLGGNGSGPPPQPPRSDVN